MLKLGIAVDVLSGQQERFGAVVARSGKSLGLLSSMAQREVVLDLHDLNVCLQRAAKEWQETKASPAEESTGQSADEF